LRENTERPITIEQGTNRLVRAETLALALSRALAAPRDTLRRPFLWDGATAARCVADLRRRSGPFRHAAEELTATEPASILAPAAPEARFRGNDDRRQAGGHRRYRRAS
jgi:hypothetical protein